MIRGKIVRLRTMEVADLPIVKQINDDPIVRSNVVGWGWPNSATEMEAWFQSSQGGTTHRWIVESADGEAIGVTGLWDVNWQSRHALTALKLSHSSGARGRGIGTDAIKTVMAFAFYDVGLNRLHGSILGSNGASFGAYVNKCGWKHEGISREHVWRNGGFQDLVQVGVLKSDFDALPDASDYRTLITTGVLGEQQA